MVARAVDGYEASGCAASFKAVCDSLRHFGDVFYICLIFRNTDCQRIEITSVASAAKPGNRIGCDISSDILCQILWKSRRRMEVTREAQFANFPIAEFHCDHIAWFKSQRRGGRVDQYFLFAERRDA